MDPGPAAHHAASAARCAASGERLARPLHPSCALIPFKNAGALEIAAHVIWNSGFYSVNTPLTANRGER